jgi:hypothetical protein
MWLWGTFMMIFFLALIGLAMWAVVRSQSRDIGIGPYGRFDFVCASDSRGALRAR